LEYCATTAAIAAQHRERVYGGRRFADRAAEIGLSRWSAKPFDLDALETLLRDAARQQPESMPSSSGNTRHV